MNEPTYQNFLTMLYSQETEWHNFEKTIIWAKIDIFYVVVKASFLNKKTKLHKINSIWVNPKEATSRMRPV